MTIRLELDDDTLDAIADAVAQRLQPNGPEPWIDVTAAAEHLACKRQRIYDLVHAGRIPHYKDGSRLLFRRSELDDWLQRQA